MPLLATDPPVSEAQRRAMWAAREGHSTLGIPASVGKKFVGAGHDAVPTTRAAGVLMTTPQGHGLFLRRAAGGDHAGEWCLPGGTAEGDETPEATAQREKTEETGLSAGEITPLHHAVSDEGVDFVTHHQTVDCPFVPTINDEHDGWAWAPITAPPQPLHPGVAGMLKQGVGEDMDPSDWQGLIDGLNKFFEEEEQEPEHAQDHFALDRASVRTRDEYGYLRVARTHISKANVCGYLGREINGVMAEDADWTPLDPDKMYQLLRDPEELKKAAPTFNNVPLLNIHVPATAEAFPTDAVIGSTGTDAVFAEPYLDNSLVFWKGDGGIDDVESNRKKELSSAYRYRADMTPGKFQGVPYDGVMRDIRGNHVALVEEGRAGSDVVVGDAAIPHMKEMFMTTKPVVLSRKAAMAQGVLAFYLRPKLASDAKIDFSAILAGVDGKNFKDKKAAIVAAVTKAVNGKLATDASIADMPKVMDSIEQMPTPEQDDAGMVTDPNAAVVTLKQPTIDANATMDDDPTAKVQAFLQGKLSPEDIAQVCAMLQGTAPAAAAVPAAGDTPPATPGTPKVPGATDAEASKPEMVSKPAMDAALAANTAAVMARLNGIRTAEDEVRPYVGKLALACDSAVAVYQTALKAMGVPEIDKVNDLVALKAVLKAQPVPGAKRQEENALAFDASATTSYDAAFPNAARIGNMG